MPLHIPSLFRCSPPGRASLIFICPLEASAKRPFKGRFCPVLEGQGRFCLYPNLLDHPLPFFRPKFFLPVIRPSSARFFFALGAPLSAFPSRLCCIPPLKCPPPSKLMTLPVGAGTEIAILRVRLLLVLSPLTTFPDNHPPPLCVNFSSAIQVLKAHPLTPKTGFFPGRMLPTFSFRQF